MKNILLVGAGQLGSRHLQSLAACTESFDFSVVDPFDDSLKIAKARFEEISNHTKHKISLFKNLKEVEKNNFELAIIATNSGVRFEVLKTSLELFKIKNIILEKVLFPKLDEYEKAQLLIEESGVMVWVNTPRRFYEFNRYLKKNYKWNAVQAKYENKSWGIGCNSVHFIDLIQYLTGSELVQVCSDRLNRKIFESKRSGYIEFEGILGCKFNDGSTLELNSDPDLNTGIMKIETSEFAFLVNDAKGICEIFDKKTNQVEIKNFTNPYQSQLTLMTYNAIMKGEDHLPTYDESMKEHVIFLKSLQDFMSTIKGEFVEVVRIT